MPKPAAATGSDAAAPRPAAELLGQLTHRLADASHEAAGGSLRNHRPAVFPRDVVGRAEHDGLADPAGPGEDGEQARSTRTQAKAILELIQQPGPAEDFRRGGTRRRAERILQLRGSYESM